jgi:hypothetical protein
MAAIIDGMQHGGAEPNRGRRRMPKGSCDKVEIPRQRKYRRRFEGTSYTIFPQPGGDSAAWALWQGTRRIGEFATYGAAKEWFEQYTVGAARSRAQNVGAR